MMVFVEINSSSTCFQLTNIAIFNTNWTHWIICSVLDIIMYASLTSRRVEPQDRQTYYLCNPCVLLVYYRFLKLSSQILRLIRGASLRQTKLIIRYITFDTLVF